MKYHCQDCSGCPAQWAFLLARLYVVTSRRCRPPGGLFTNGASSQHRPTACISVQIQTNFSCQL